MAWGAGLQPKRVQALICIESNFGLSGQWIRDLLPGAPSAPERMQNALLQFKKNQTRELRVFETIDEAIDANKNNETFKKSETTARNIVMRHIRPHPNGWTFIHDPKTYGQSQFLHVNEEHSRAFLGNITCPVLQIVRSKQPFPNLPPSVQEQHDRRNTYIKQRDLVIVEGMHHVHSDKPEATADAVISWLVPKLDSISKL